MDTAHIRNFCIIAHVDHGKSTLADRFLEMTGTVEKRHLKAQMLDMMDLERERGITIKLQPVRMQYRLQGKLFELNLIDTPGHVDFTYEVSRSLAAVEGAILLVDATQGIQAQTLANLYLAMEQNLTIIPVVNKIDLPAAQVDRSVNELVRLLGVKPEEVLKISGKTGLGAEALLSAVIERVPPPNPGKIPELRALIFDSKFDDYRGVIAYVRVVDGQVSAGQTVRFLATGKDSDIIEVGTFAPELKRGDLLTAGEIGYLATGLKHVADCRVGDTVTLRADQSPLPGYRQVKPMVFAGFFCREGDDYPHLRSALEKLALSDSALQYEPEHSPALGYGFRCGLLGLLHLEIVQERLRREYGQDVVVTVPSVAYQVVDTQGATTIIRSPQQLPSADRYQQVLEPVMRLDVVTPKEYLGGVMQMVSSRRGEYQTTEYLDDELAVLHYRIPLTQLLVDFYDKLKGISAGYASLNYEFDSYRPCEVVRLDIMVADDPEESLASLVYRDEAYEVGKRIVAKLKETIPKHQFVIKLQASVTGRVIAAERISALRKDVTVKLSGGDYTRKRKLLEKQKKGKKKMMAAGVGRVEVPAEAYLSVLKR
ncbi:MAG: GTP-binding protein LepA [Parcubacteria group bacterium Gr01-1014_31]|nr:MAG: GTP-binding protein LepA [Parcubacteria group bacterium Gr01-1014_31]